MKINSLLESLLAERAQFTPQVVAYHATSKSNLRSILKSGLIPNHSKNGYGSDEKDLDFGFSLTSLEGVYLTTRWGNVEAIAKGIPAPVIIICKVQNRSATLDEDRLVGGVIGSGDIARDIRMYVHANPNMTPEQEDDYINKLTQEESSRIIKSLTGKVSDEVLKRVQPDILKFVNTLAHISFKRFPTQEAMDAAIRDQQTVMTKKLKNLLHTDNPREQHSSFKIDQTIGFSGANKIVGIYDFMAGVGWGDLAHWERDAYHKVKTPSELLGR
jgi:hypothetical protein